MIRMRTAILTSEGFHNLSLSNPEYSQRRPTEATHLPLNSMRILGDCNFPLLYLPNE
jgi:hypothetical protein